MRRRKIFWASSMTAEAQNNELGWLLVAGAGPLVDHDCIMGARHCGGIGGGVHNQDWRDLKPQALASASPASDSGPC